MKIRVNPWLLLIIASVVFAQITPDCGCEEKPEINVLAVINGVKITKKDLSIDTTTQVSIAQESVITARSQALNQLVTKTVLDAEAKRRGLTVAKLLELELTAKVKEPTEADARAFYEENKTDRGRDYKSAKNEILAHLKSERQAARAKEFANALRVAAQVSVTEQQVTPPTNEADLARVFATVNGVNITSLDIEQSLLPFIFQVQKQVYAIRKRELDLKINDMLLEEEAKRLQTTPKALLDQNVRGRMSIPSEEQVRAFYEKNKAKFNGEFSEVKVQIFQYLLAEEQQKLVAAYAEQLRKGAAVQIYLTEPQPPNVRQLCCNPLD
ncbi:MAG TPA: hypothetical protein VFT44_10110 [Pyrinomonadaceae bacterium]|nr:hypothetical protein [Pyrinomonadaceae bacterium]